MVLIGLLGVGVGLALDAYAERSNKSHADQKERQRLEGICEPEIVSSEISRKQQEEDAFKELQKYANFQNDLSARVLDEISTEEMRVDYFSIPPNTNHENGDSFFGSFPNCSYDAQQTTHLPYPIFISHNISEYGRLAWTRTYLPSLMYCGIEQQSFLRFIDSFNKSLEFSSWLETINIAALENDQRNGGSSTELSYALVTAARLVKSRQRRDSFLEIANSNMFYHRGLIAIVLTFQPENPSQIISIDTNSTTMNKQTGRRTNLGYPTSKLKQIGTFVTEYTDLTPSFRRETTTPSNIDPRLINQKSNASTTPISSLISAVSKNRAHKRRQKSVSSNRQSSRMKKIMDRGSEEGHFGKSSKPETNGTQDSFKLEPGAIYLVIMNDPDSQSRPLRSPWGVSADKITLDHDSNTMIRFGKQHSVVGINGQMEYFDGLAMERKAPPPPAYTPRSYNDWMEED